MPPSKNKWPEYQELVLKMLEDHSEGLEGLREDMTKLRIEVAMLKVKSGIWGAAAGLIAVATYLAFAFLKG